MSANNKREQILADVVVSISTTRVSLHFDCTQLVILHIKNKYFPRKTMAPSSSSRMKRNGSFTNASKILFFTAFFLIAPSSSYMATNPTTRSFHLQSSTMMAPADLTPAIDKFVRLPSGPNIDPYFMTAKGPVPLGPEPFGMVGDELQPLSDYVKDLVASENPVLTMAASHFFEKVHLYYYVSILYILMIIM
jgi:hypothetical protein